MFYLLFFPCPTPTHLFLYFRFGVADNNQPSLIESGGEADSNAGSNSDVDGNNPGGDESIADARNKLSDGTNVNPVGGAPSNGASPNGRQLREPLITETTL